MKPALKKTFFAAMFATGAGFGAAGAYMAADAAAQEYILQKPQHDAAKACVKEVRAGRECTAEQYRWMGEYADRKNDYALGLSWLFGGASFVRMSSRRLKSPGSKPSDKPAAKSP